MTKINKRRHSHNATDTQRESWARFQFSTGRYTQEQRVLSYLKGRVANSRQIAVGLSIERSAVNRVLRNLEDAGLVVIVSEAKCPITRIRTQFYTANDPNTGTTQGDVPKSIQGDLFGSESQYHYND